MAIGNSVLRALGIRRFVNSARFDQLRCMTAIIPPIAVRIVRFTTRPNSAYSISYAKSGGFTIPDSVITLGHAFSNCTNLTSATIGKAFYGIRGFMLFILVVV